MSKIIGIDLGTTNSCVSVIEGGEPVVIGGLFQQEEEVSEKRVPVLGKIPIIGFLFKTKVVSIVDTEFIIYLVPFVEKDESEVLSEEENLLRLKKKYGGGKEWKTADPMNLKLLIFQNTKT